MIVFKDFNIRSTSQDYDLFFNSSYQNAVNSALNRISERRNIPEGLTVACFRSCVELSKDHQTFDFEILDTYN